MCKTINERLRENKEFVTAIKLLFENKPKRKVIQKAVEELSELTTKLMQRLNDPDKVSDEDIAEEIVDVAMHIELLQMYFDKPLLKGLTAGKVNKLLISKTLAKYANKSVRPIQREGEFQNDSY